MLVAGARGFAKEVLEILYQLNALEDLVFFDDITEDLPEKLYNRFPVLRNISQVENHFKNFSNQFTIGIGSPVVRRKMYDKLLSVGGSFTSAISPKASIGHFDTTINEGCNIITGTVIDNSVNIGKGCLLNTNCTIGHDSLIGDFAEICPGAVISGNCNIGAYSFIGTNATILPKIRIGANVVVAAGAVVTKDVPDNSMVAGIPAAIKKVLPKLEF